MDLSRRDFIKVFGISIASLMLTRCKGLPQPTPTPTQIPTPEISCALAGVDFLIWLKPRLILGMTMTSIWKIR
jgi:hypothetical protein